jgi:hypothetical protein
MKASEVIVSCQGPIATFGLALSHENAESLAFILGHTLVAHGHTTPHMMFELQISKDVATSMVCCQVSRRSAQPKS